MSDNKYKKTTGFSWLVNYIDAQDVWFDNLTSYLDVLDPRSWYTRLTLGVFKYFSHVITSFCLLPYAWYIDLYNLPSNLPSSLASIISATVFTVICSVYHLIFCLLCALGLVVVTIVVIAILLYYISTSAVQVLKTYITQGLSRFSSLARGETDKETKTRDIRGNYRETITQTDHGVTISGEMSFKESENILRLVGLSDETI